MRIHAYNDRRIRARFGRPGSPPYWVLLAYTLAAFSQAACTLAIVAALTCLSAAEESQDGAEESLRFFERKVRPILVERCFECHSGASKILQGGLRLDQRARVVAGGDTGPAAIPGDPAQSLLIRSLQYDGDLQMPPTGKLPDAEIAVLREWIERGIPQVDSKNDGEGVPQSDSDNSSNQTSWESRLRHWAFQPLPKSRSSPLVTDNGSRAAIAPLTGWFRDPIDGFVGREWPGRGLASTGIADPAALVRRATFDLLGLPPTWDEQDEFQHDGRPDAYERLVDRLLGSPKFGERWGRHWLDLTRYCDVPESWRESVAKPWLYRDWVVQAMNRDLPYDQFVRQQLAADLLPNHQPEDNAALGMLGLSPTYWKELKLDHVVIKQVVAEEWEERIEALGATFLGMTLACARCHDHKYDPITTRDYYGLAGVLASIQLDDRPMFTESAAEDVRKAHAQAKKLQAEIDKLAAITDKNEESEKQLAANREELAAVKQTPHFDSLWAYGVTEASLHVLPDGPHRTKLEYRAGEPQDLAIQIRGNPANAGPVVPRGFVAALRDETADGPDARELRFRHGSGRLELAEAIVTNASHLAARTMANRIWRHHFGRGLVTTPSNLGIQGQPPTHPALLDDLARRFIDNQWSTKKMHRALMLTATYRQAARVDPAELQGETTAGDVMDRGRDRDPDNVYYWRSAIRRLEFEAWRDAVLAVTGQLDCAMAGPPSPLADPNNRRRTLYGQVKRRELTDMQRLHDFPDPVSHSAAREPTTTPLQQLFALNSPWLQQVAIDMAQRLAAQWPDAPAEQIGQAYRAILLRPASAEELSTAIEFFGASGTSGTSGASGAGSANGSGSTESLAQLIHALLASNEFQYLD